MLNHAKTHLQIFENFTVDHNLPKFQQPPTATEEDQNSPIVIGGFAGGSTSLRFFDDVPSVSNPMGNISSSGDWIEDTLNQRIEISKRAWKRLFKTLFGWLIPKKTEKDPKISALDFFKMVKANLVAPEVYEEKIKEFIKVANHALTMGQRGLYEEIMRDINIVKKEALLLQTGFSTCITEDQIVQFYKESDKGLSLHYVRNFGRVIPNEVCKQKIKADELFVFDNYVVLHYDKDQKSFKETQAERDKRKDPILFGLIAGTRKLYYIADWVDEYCDLTIKQLVDKFGQEAITANDISVKYKTPGK